MADTPRAFNVQPLCQVCGQPLGNTECEACRPRVVIEPDPGPSEIERLRWRVAELEDELRGANHAIAALGKALEKA